MFKNTNPDELDKYLKEQIEKYGLRTQSVKRDNPDGSASSPEIYKDIEKGYNQLRSDYNSSVDKDYRDLYLLSCYSINHLMRFNSNSQFNVSVGADSYHSGMTARVKESHNRLQNVKVWNKNIFDIDFTQIQPGDFVYLDPPYLNTEAVYNEKRAFGGWSIEDDYKLFNIIDELNSRGVKFGLSNVFENRGIENTHLKEWAEKNGYYVHHFEKTYNPFSTENSQSDEVYITNVYNVQYEKVGLF